MGFTLSVTLFSKILRWPKSKREASKPMMEQTMHMTDEMSSWQLGLWHSFSVRVDVNEATVISGLPGSSIAAPSRDPPRTTAPPSSWNPRPTRPRQTLSCSISASSHPPTACSTHSIYYTLTHPNYSAVNYKKDWVQTLELSRHCTILLILFCTTKTFTHNVQFNPFKRATACYIFLIWYYQYKKQAD